MSDSTLRTLALFLIGLSILLGETPGSPADARVQENALSLELTSELQTVYLRVVRRQEGSLYALGAGSGFEVYDISNPAYPTPLALAPEISGFYMDVEGDYAYVTSGNNTLQIVDVSDPANPTLLSTYSDFEWYDNRPPQLTYVAASGNKVFVYVVYQAFYWGCLFGERIIMLDVSDPANPLRVGELITGHRSPLAASGDYLYASHLGGLHVFDARPPSQPPKIADLQFDPETNEPDTWLVVGNGYALLRFTEGGDPCNLGGPNSWHIVDVTVPASPQEVFSEADATHYPYHAADGYVYVQGPDGFEVRSHPEFTVHTLLEDFGVSWLDSSDGFFYATQLRIPGGEYLIAFRLSAVSETVDPAVASTLSYSDTLGVTSFELLAGSVLSPTVVSILPVPKADYSPLHSTQLHAFDIRGHLPDQQLTLERFQQPVTATLPLPPPPPDPDQSWEFLHWNGTYWTAAAATCDVSLTGASIQSTAAGGRQSGSLTVQFCRPGKYALFELPVLDKEVYLPAAFH